MGIFGGNKSTQQSSSQQASGNHTLDFLSGYLNPVVTNSTTASHGISNLLGLNGAQAGRDALDTYANSAGMDFTRDQGTKAITGSAAARGMLNSGSTLKALMQYGQGLGQTYVGDYMKNLLGLSQLGVSAGGVLSDAGRWSTGSSNSTQTSSSKPGLLQGIGGLASGLGSMGVTLSDPRLKKNVVKLEEMSDGLGIYEYEYIFEPGKRVGVMADEVKELRPWAMGPDIGGYMSVRYGEL